jgi:hypothetical protein
VSEEVAEYGAGRHRRGCDDPLLVVNLRGDDALLFARVKAAIVARAGCDVTNSAVIRAALLALERGA